MAFLQSISRPAAALAALAMLAGCTTESTVAPVSNANSLAAAPADAEAPMPAVKHSTCKSPIRTTRKNALVADRVTPGDPYYIEFRLRPSTAIPTGHMYVIYGDLDAQGNPVNQYYSGLFPKGSVAGLYTGMVLPVPIPGELEPSFMDCSVLPAAAYRRSLTAAQYRSMLTLLARYKANPPKWAMLSFNCNHYSASLGEAAGLKAPKGTRSLEFVSAQYFSELVKVNGDTIRGKAPAYEAMRR